DASNSASATRARHASPLQRRRGVGAGHVQSHILSPATAQSESIVGRTPRSAAEAPVGLHGVDEADFVGKERVQGDPRGPGGPPHKFRYVALAGHARPTALSNILTSRGPPGFARVPTRAASIASCTRRPA